MVELADTPDLGSGARACRFKSCYPHFGDIRWYFLLSALRGYQAVFPVIRIFGISGGIACYPHFGTSAGITGTEFTGSDCARPTTNHEKEFSPSMDDGSRAAIPFIIVLFLLSAYFALTETALSSVSKSKVRLASERGDKRALKVLYALDNFEDAITTLLICTNICHIAATSLITVIVTRTWGMTAVTLSTIITTIVMFFAAEMLPKSIGKKSADKAILVCAAPLVMLMKILKPLTILLAGIGKLTLRVLPGEQEQTVTEDELYDIIEDMAEDGAIDEERGDLISSALQFADVTVDSILTPRVDLVALNVDEAPEKVLEIVREQNHSRIPVFENTIDNIVGVLSIRKFLKAYITLGRIPSVRSLLDTVYYAHQSSEIDELLNEMSRRKQNMAVILDGYGGTLGVVTVEDILEEIVGEIWDEDDEVKEPVVELAPGTFLVAGDETVSDTFEFMEREIPEVDDDRFTNLLMSDWFCEQFVNLPARGDSFEYEGLRFSADEIEHNRILKIRVTVQKDGLKE